MGLDISSKSDKNYHYSYSGIHYVRFMAYRSIGGEEVYIDWYRNQAAEESDDKKYKEALKKFPNLYWHSDCDGKYTLDGKVESFDNPGNLQTGNSKELLEELQFVKDNLPQKYDPTITDRDWYVFNMLYDVVKDVVNNHDGRIEFH